MPLTLEEQYPIFADTIPDARKEGYSEDEIFGWIQDKIGEAEKEGYSMEEILEYMGSPTGVQPLSLEAQTGVDAVTGAEEERLPPEPYDPEQFVTVDAVSEADAGQGPIRTRHRLEPEQEMEFQQWYKDVAQAMGINPDPDDPGHKYDYRGAWLSGEGPDTSGHWPSRFKDPDHPNRFVDGIDTITGEPAPDTPIPTGEIPEVTGFQPIPELAEHPGKFMGEEEEAIPELRQMKERGIAGLQAGLTEGEPPPEIPPGTEPPPQRPEGISDQLIYDSVNMMKDIVYPTLNYYANLNRLIGKLPGGRYLSNEEAARNFAEVFKPPPAATTTEAIARFGPQLGGELAPFMISPGGPIAKMTTFGVLADPDRPIQGAAQGALFGGILKGLPLIKGGMKRFGAGMAAFGGPQAFDDTMNYILHGETPELREYAKATALALMGSGVSPKAMQEKLIAQLTRKTIKEGGGVRNYYISPEKVAEVFRGQKKDVLSPEELDVYTSLGLSGPQVREALKKGLDIRVKAEELIKVVDRPWFAHLKKYFKMQPGTEEVYTTQGKTTFGYGKRKPVTPTEKPTEPTKEPTERKPLKEGEKPQEEPSAEDFGKDVEVFKEVTPEQRLAKKISEIPDYQRFRRVRSRIQGDIDRVKDQQKRQELQEAFDKKQSELEPKFSPNAVIAEKDTFLQVKQDDQGKFRIYRTKDLKKKGRAVKIGGVKVHDSAEQAQAILQDYALEKGLPEAELKPEERPAPEPEPKEELLTPERREEIIEKVAQYHEFRGQRRKDFAEQVTDENLILMEKDIEAAYARPEPTVLKKLEERLADAEPEDRAKAKEILKDYKKGGFPPPQDFIDNPVLVEVFGGPEAIIEWQRKHFGEKNAELWTETLAEIEGYEEVEEAEVDDILAEAEQEKEGMAEEQKAAEGKKKPWQMTQAEFIREQAHLQPEPIRSALYADRETDETIELRKRFIERHKQAIKEAQEEGEEVPERVLQDYYPSPIVKEKSIGVNEEGLELYEDAKGVRYYIEEGVKVTEPVGVAPTGETGVIQRRDRFKTVEELETEREEETQRLADETGLEPEDIEEIGELAGEPAEEVRAGQIWDQLTHEERIELSARSGWAPRTAKRIGKTDWADLSTGAKNAITRHIEEKGIEGLGEHPFDKMVKAEEGYISAVKNAYENMSWPWPELEKIVYRSGVNRLPVLRGYQTYKAPVLVSLADAPRELMDELVTYPGQVLLDSGAFTAFTKGRPVNFDSVLEQYEDFYKKRNAWVKEETDWREQRSLNMAVIAPDVIGNQLETLTYLEQYRDRLHELANKGVNVIIPLQKGDQFSPFEMYKEVLKRVMVDDEGVPVYPSAYMRMSFGIPEFKKPWTKEDFTNLYEGVEKWMPMMKPMRLHLLGISEFSNKWVDLIEHIEKVAPKGVRITADASRSRPYMAEGRSGTAVMNAIKAGIPPDVLVPEDIVSAIRQIAKEEAISYTEKADRIRKLLEEKYGKKVGTKEPGEFRLEPEKPKEVTALSEVQKQLPEGAPPGMIPITQKVWDDTPMADFFEQWEKADDYRDEIEAKLREVRQDLSKRIGRLKKVGKRKEAEPFEYQLLRAEREHQALLGTYSDEIEAWRNELEAFLRARINDEGFKDPETIDEYVEYFLDEVEPQLNRGEQFTLDQMFRKKLDYFKDLEADRLEEQKAEEVEAEPEAEKPARERVPGEERQIKLSETITPEEFEDQKSGKTFKEWAQAVMDYAGNQLATPVKIEWAGFWDRETRPPEGMIQFNGPFTGSSLNLKPSELTPQNILNKMAYNYILTEPDSESFITNFPEVDSLTEDQKTAIIKGEKELKDYVRISGVRPADTEALEGAPPEELPGVSPEAEGEEVLREPGEEGGGAGREPVETGEEPRPSGRGSKKPVLPTEREGPSEPGAESPTLPGSYRITDADELNNPGSNKRRISKNINAIRTLKKIEEEGRFATPEEQKALVRYSGWGGLSKVFDRWAGGEWREANEALDKLLTEEEMQAARGTVLNAFYTNPKVIGMAYQVLDKMGFKGGRILEPSAGIGNFIGLTPPGWGDKTIFTAVEMDPLSARIAQQLYQAHDIKLSRFEKVKLPNDFYDAVVANVPFGDYQVFDVDYRDLNLPIHDYFVVKALDKVKPGGVAAIITSRYTMDKMNSKGRREIGKRGQLVLALRLPDTAFKKSAGTEVVTDILFFKKIAPGTVKEGEPKWLRTRKIEITEGDQKNKVDVNEYFLDNPKRVLGKHSLGGSMYAANTYTVKGELKEEQLPYSVAEDDEPYGVDLDDVLEDLPENVYDEAPAATSPEEELTSVDILGPIAKEEIQEGAFVVEKNKIYQVTEGKLKPAKVPKGEFQRMKSIIGLKAAARKLVRLQLDSVLSDPEDKHTFDLAQENLNKLYDEFVEKYGPINVKDNYKLIYGDPHLTFVRTIEKYDEKTGKAVKSPFFTEITIQRYQKPLKADTSKEALLISLNEFGGIDMNRMQELTGKSTQEISNELRGLIFKDPQGEKWVVEDEYLSGDVKTKLEQARQAAKLDDTYKGNIEALEKVQPEDKPPERIRTGLGTNWIPTKDYERFVIELLQSGGNQVRVLYIGATGKWDVKIRPSWSSSVSAYNRAQFNQSESSRDKFSTQHFTTVQLIDKAMNGRKPEVRLKDEYGKDMGRDEVATAAANEALGRIVDRFREWVFEEPERRERLVRKYNDEMNRIRPRQFNGSHMTFPGSNPLIKFRPNQKDGAWRIITSKTNTLLEHEVGAGKTYTMIGAAMELKRLGLGRKSCIACFKHQVPDFRKSTYELYPAAKLLIPGENDFNPKKRQQFLARLATEPWDIIVMSHEQLGMVPMSIQRQMDFIEDQIHELEQSYMQMRELGLTKRDPTVRDLIKRIEKLQAKLEKLMAQEGKDPGITFEETGIDWLMVDEAQQFKNLFYTTSMNRVAGLGDASGSGRAFELFQKTQYISNEIHGGNRGIVFATATPVANSMVEMYNVMRYLYPQALKATRTMHFDAWAKMYGEVVEAAEVRPEGGGYRVNSRFKRFINGRELMRFYREVADIQTQEMLQLDRPKIKGGTAQGQENKPDALVKAYVQYLVIRAQRLRSGGVDPREDNFPKICTDGRLCALDPRLVLPGAPDNPKSKLNLAINNIFGLHNKIAEDRLTQIVFCDLGTPGKKTSTRQAEISDIYQDIKDKLVKLGVPADEIAFIHDATTEEAKASLFNQVNEGTVRILLGSTQKMGTGMNVQKRLYAAHFLTPPYRPDHLEQGEGRLLRPGNMNPEVEIHRYVTKGTFDAYMWQLLENKRQFINQYKSGTDWDEIQDIDDVELSYAEMKAIASGNPLVKEKIELEIKVGQLENSYRIWQQRRYRHQENLATVPQQLEALNAEKAKLETDIKQRDENKLPEGKFKINFQGKEFDKRKEAGEEFYRIFKEVDPADTEQKFMPIGNFRGFKLGLKKMRLTQDRIKIEGNSGLSHIIFLEKEAASALGLIRRIENELDRFEDYIDRNQKAIDQANDTLEVAQREVDVPFEENEELAAKRKRLDFLQRVFEQQDAGAIQQLTEEERRMIRETGQITEAEIQEILDLLGPDDPLAQAIINFIQGGAVPQAPAAEYYVWDNENQQRVGLNTPPEEHIHKDLMEGFTFFTHKNVFGDKKGWILTEKETGMRVSAGRSANEAVEEGRRVLSKYDPEQMAQIIRDNLTERGELPPDKVDSPGAEYKLDTVIGESEAAFGSKQAEDRAVRRVAKQVERINNAMADRDRPASTFADSVTRYRSKIAKELVKKKALNLRGYRLTPGNEAQDIAELFQVFRSPRMEILHAIYVDKNGKILAHHAETIGAVNTVHIKENMTKWRYDIQNRAKRLGADRIHFLHNHPSGDVTQSPNDVNLAHWLKSDAWLAKVPRKHQRKMKGPKVGESVVIDHGKYSVLVPTEQLAYRLETGEYKVAEGVENWTTGVGPKVRTPKDVAQFVASTMTNLGENKSLLVFLNSQNVIQGWTVQGNAIWKQASYPYGAGADGFNKMKKIITQQLRAHDSTRAVLLSNDENLRKILRHGLVGDFLADVMIGPKKFEEFGGKVAYKSMKNELEHKFQEPASPHLIKESYRLFEEQKPYGKDLTPEQQEALDNMKAHVQKLMDEARKLGLRMTRDYLKNKGYTGKQIRMIFHIRKLINEERAKLGTPNENALMVLDSHISNDKKLHELTKFNKGRLYRILKRGLVDVSGNIKPELEKYGTPGHIARMDHDLIAGASTWATIRLEKITDDIYGPGPDKKFGKSLNRFQHKLLDYLIQSIRTATIERYKRIKNPDRLVGQHHEDFIEYEPFAHAVKKRFDYDLTREQFDQLMERAQLYGEAFDANLEYLFDNHLISEKSYEQILAKGFYEPRRFIQHIDPEESYTFGGSKTISVRSSGIKRLTTGSFEALENDSLKLLHQSTVSTYNRVARNRANISLWDLADKVPDNGIVHKAAVVGKYKSGALKFEKTPAGHEAIDVMIEGQRRRMFMPNEWAREWIMRDPSIDDKAAFWIGTLTGAKLLRPMATGAFAPEFSVTNFARDSAHIWVVTDTYSSFLPKAMWQHRRAVNEVWKDALLRQGLWEDYMEEGGGMHFLTTQGRMFSIEANRSLRNFERYATTLQNFSEIVNRLAIMHHEMKYNGKSKREAAWIARNYMDFYQGGSWTKMLDAGVPYLSAAVVGTRGVFRAFYERPIQTTWKIGQLMLFAVGLYLANTFINKWTMDRMSDSDKVRYWCISTPIRFKDKNGNERGMYFVIAKDQGQRFFAQVAEQSIRAVFGDSVRTDQITQGFKDAIPATPTDLMPPVVDAWMGYRGNEDFWRNKDIWESRYYEAGKIEPRLEYDRYVHPALVQLGDKMNWSPKRMQYVLEQFFTYGNLFTSIVGGGTRFLFDELPGNERDLVWQEYLARFPFIRRGVRLTRVIEPDVKYEMEQTVKEVYSMKFRQLKQIRDFAEDYYAKEKQGMPEAKMVLDNANKYIASQPKVDQQRLKDMFKEYPKYDDIPNREFWFSIREYPPELKAYMFEMMYVRANEEQKRVLESQRRKMPGMDSDRVRNEIMKLRKRREELNK